MKYPLIFVLLSSAFLLISCGSDTSPGVQSNKGDAISIETSTSVQPSGGVGPGSGPSGGGGGSIGGGTMPLEEGTFDLDIRNGKGVLDFTIKSGSRAMIRFDGTSGKELTASLISISGDVSGYRFAQILFPDGNSDGPFERSIVYDLSMTGRHGLRITPDVRAGSAGGGKMRIEATLR